MSETDYSSFNEIGLTRQKCLNCGKHFWASTKRKNCGDSDCDRYTFLGAGMVPQPYSVSRMRSKFIDFFKETHGFVKPYPVVPRWREDVLLVNASIYNFQPHVTMGYAKPPENPLVMSQPSIRMMDVDNVGVTGRHLTGFEMMCHDSFNYPDKEVYWKNETISYCNSLLTKSLGIDQANITYTEKPWSGGGNAGNALEVFVGGVEIATLVFMDLRKDRNGTTQIDGDYYSPMELKIVDTGYGLERMTWLSKSKGTIYEAVYPELVSHLIDKAEVRELPEEYLMQYLDLAIHSNPYNEREVISQTTGLLSKKFPHFKEREFLESLTKMRSVWSLADHSRSLLFMLSSYVIPSNVKVGYLARMLIRRSLRHFQNLGIKEDLGELLELQYASYKDIIGSFDFDFSNILLERERSKYEEVLKSGTALVHRIVDKKGKLSQDDFRQLYESHGIPYETISQIVKEKTGETPEYRPIPVKETIEQVEVKDVPSIEKYDTRALYYDDTSIREFTAIVIQSGKDFVVLNQTAFYPEGGGQPYDTGFLYYGSRKFSVRAVQKINGTIVHWVDGKIPEKVRVRGEIDNDRRDRLMVSHSSTHLLLAATRKVLGPHIWQSGVQKGTDYSRLDVTHYEKISDEDIRKIEKLCLELIKAGKKISVRMIEWNLALKKYGFGLFQGGVPLSSKLRVVEIEDTDAEGCGGTHLKSTSEIGMIKIVKVESIQEGIQRIIFASGIGALEYTQKLHDFYSSTIPALASGIDTASQKFAKVFESYLENRKRYGKTLDELADLLILTAERKLENGIEYFTGKAEISEDLIPLLVPRVKKIGSPLMVISKKSGSRILTLISDREDARKLLFDIMGKNKVVSGNSRIASLNLGSADEKLIS